MAGDISGKVYNIAYIKHSMVLEQYTCHLLFAHVFMDNLEG